MNPELEERPEISLEDLPAGSTVHLVGAGGAGMSAIGIVLLEMGYAVEGSDLKESSYVRRLRKRGAVIGLGHRTENLLDCRLVVRSSAIRADNPEILEANRRGIPVISRAQMLAAIMDTRKGIAIAGTHGKTTTSSIVTSMLMGCGADPSYLIGGELNEIGGNAHYGGGEYLVAETDESDGSLLVMRPEVAVLTNVDWDHLDYFDSPDHTARIFRKFLDVLPLDGIAVICGDDPQARAVGEDYKSSGGMVHFYGEAPDNDFRFEVTASGAWGTTFRVLTTDGILTDVKTGLPGRHNVYNSLAAFAVGNLLGFPTGDLAKGIESCQGVRRRFEYVGTCDGIEVRDDYAHHPTEVKALLDMAAETSGAERIMAVFQPHRYSRTRLLGPKFGESFTGADLVVVTDVYGAGEDPEPGVTGRLIADSILEHEPSKDVTYVESRAELAGEVVRLLKSGDLVITMGAGDITQCAREILDLLEDSEV